MSTLTDISQSSCEYIALHLRDCDRMEIFGLRPHDNPLVLAMEMITTFRNTGRARVAWHDGKPAAIVGFAEYRPGVWQVALLGTNDFRNVAIDCLRWIRETASDLIANHGGKRLQCDSHEDHHEAHRFLKALGAIPEGPPMRFYGKCGSAYQRYVWFAGMNDQLITGKVA